MKKIILLLLVCILAVSCFAGCSKNNEPTENTQSKEEVVINIVSVPDASAYIMADGTMLRTGDKFPENPTEGDIFQCENYRYGYKKIFNAEKNSWISIEEDAWTVHIVNEETTSYDDCFKKINGKTVIVPSTTTNEEPTNV